LTLWAWFNRTELQYAIGNSSMYTDISRVDMPAISSLYPTKKRTISFYSQNAQKMFISLTAATKGLNYTRNTIYGELSTPADPSYSAINIMSREGINVFVRNSKNNTLPFSIF